MNCNPFLSVKSLKRFANLVCERLARDGHAIPFPTMLEGMAAGCEVRNWNSLAAALPKGGNTEAAPDPDKIDVRVTMEDWRFASAGPEAAREELSDEEQAPWPVTIQSSGARDTLIVAFHDPIHDFDADTDRNRSAMVGFELDKGVPKVLLSPLGEDNLANIWMAADRLVIDLNSGDQALIITRDGWQAVPRSTVDYNGLGQLPRASD